MHDWHNFFHHIPYHLDKGTYHIFDPQWKAEILHWFGREDVGKEQKEAFIQALLDFDDGCGDFYRYRAYFLASEAIAYFKDCSQGDAIVGQLLKWSYAYFRQDKRDWQIFPQPLVQTARAALETTDRERVIAAFVQLIHTTESRSILRHSAERLGQLDPGNKRAIAALIQLMQVTQNTTTLYKLTVSLAKIGDGNEAAIAALIQLMETTLDKTLCYAAILAVGRIACGNQTAINALVKFLQTNQGDNICGAAAEALWLIDPGNTAVTRTLIHIVETNQNEHLLANSVVRLAQIDPGNTAVITALSERLESNDESRRLRAAENLVKIDPENKAAIATLVQLLQTTSNEWIRLRTAERLVQIDKYYEFALNVLFELVHLQHEYVPPHFPALSTLESIDPTHQLVLKALVQLIKTTQDVKTLRFAAEDLVRLNWAQKMTKAQLDEVITTFIQFIQTFEEINGNPVYCAGNPSYESCLLDTADSLKRLLQVDHLPQVVIALKDNLKLFYKNSSYRYEAVLSLFWYCAQNMPYPDFYNLLSQTGMRNVS